MWKGYLVLGDNSSQRHQSFLSTNIQFIPRIDEYIQCQVYFLEKGNFY